MCVKCVCASVRAHVCEGETVKIEDGCYVAVNHSGSSVPCTCCYALRPQRLLRNSRGSVLEMMRNLFCHLDGIYSPYSLRFFFNPRGVIEKAKLMC